MVTAIVLAAGLSKRMEGPNKLLLTLGTKTLVETTIQKILESGVEEVIVVLGNDAEKVRQKIQNFPVQILVNEKFESGMTSSIQKGVNAATGIGYMICLADMMAIESGEYQIIKEAFLKKYSEDSKCIGQPSFGNKRGNPVIFSDYYRQEILAHQDPEGCRDIVQTNAGHVFKIEMPTNHVLLDLDTPEDFERFHAKPQS
ncbi:MAG: nucleotidyltransferase family protein [Bacteroidetes bacterium]|nr:MAG: nucleotidyltransferase family protein [Bacteroidota bacterium]